MRYAHAGGWARVVLAVLMLILPVLAAGRTIEVMPGKSGSIGDALAAAVAGDMVAVGCGTYDESLLVIPDGVTLSGACGPGGVIIRSWGYLSLIHVAQAASGVAVNDLTFTLVDPDAPREIWRGDAAYLNDALVTFTRVVFRDFEAGYGGAVYATNGSRVTFEDCVFEDNEARAAGGAVAATGGSELVFTGCLFAGNRSGKIGGAINAGLGSSLAMTSCTLVGNEAAVGGAIATFDPAAPATLDRVIIAETLAGAAWIGDGVPAPDLTCSDLYGNAGGDFVGVLEAELGQAGNVSGDPLFCGAANPGQPYKLNASSPCLPPNSACGSIGAFGQGCDVVTGVPGGEALPAVTGLHDAYPNPFNPRTTIKYDVREAGPVSIAIYDVAGRLVHRLVDRTVAPGSYEATWEGRDDRGRSAAAGVYFLRLETADVIDTKRMTLIK